MPVPRHISKSRFCVGLQCHRRLWWEVHEPGAPELRPDDRLRVIFDRGQEAEALLPAIPRELRRMRQALERKLPDVDPGEHCSDPYDCPFVGRCHPELPEHHVSTLYGIRGAKLAEWREVGCETIHDLPDDAKLSPVQRRQVRAVKAGRLVVEDGLADALAEIEHPVAFLDFETINPPVPVWNGCHPYEPTPVQMSCHVVGARGRTEHHEHLAEADADPRPALAAAVVRACEGARAVVAYNAAFEAGCLDRLAVAVPKLARPLGSIRKRLVDLLPIVRDHVYHPAFGGSFGLKAVAPALVRGAGYDDLDVADGDTASTLLEGLLLAPEALKPSDRARIRKHLLAYCARDTEVLVRVSELLRDLASRTA